MNKDGISVVELPKDKIGSKPKAAPKDEEKKKPEKRDPPIRGGIALPSIDWDMLALDSARHPLIRKGCGE
jgi:hypothetical protein